MTKSRSKRLTFWSNQSCKLSEWCWLAQVSHFVEKAARSRTAGGEAILRLWLAFIRVILLDVCIVRAVGWVRWVRLVSYQILQCSLARLYHVCSVSNVFFYKSAYKTWKASVEAGIRRNAICYCVKLQTTDVRCHYAQFSEKKRSLYINKWPSYSQLVFHGRHFGTCNLICVKLLQIMSGVIPRNLKKRRLHLQPFFPPRSKTRHTHTHTRRQTHDDNIRWNAMHCIISFRLIKINGINWLFRHVKKLLMKSIKIQLDVICDGQLPCLTIATNVQIPISAC